ncbi:MAG: rhodanese-like domain-containing protein [Bacteroidetes bacterium]|nr:rhodanese-like domain-containing protein [Bacteroidota bacterium]
MSVSNYLKTPGVTVVDVREPWEFSEGHYPNSLNIPLGEVPNRLEELMAMSKPLILVCRSGNRSGMAMTMLQNKGANEVYNGGAWDALEA